MSPSGKTFHVLSAGFASESNIPILVVALRAAHAAQIIRVVNSSRALRFERSDCPVIVDLQELRPSDPVRGGSSRLP